ncbi:hypothetical protein EYC84_011275 [Monilinia fructicola]|uniref:Uncharacterized protein n=1 Tax=Monilinia fructicola TaxID=38448 RepID=A0A5M9J5M7_MONFR|nr:hypothetical protein EYC84_011275 [Monilinia fructicola]
MAFQIKSIKNIWKGSVGYKVRLTRLYSRMMPTGQAPINHCTNHMSLQGWTLHGKLLSPHILHFTEDGMLNFVTLRMFQTPHQRHEYQATGSGAISLELADYAIA